MHKETMLTPDEMIAIRGSLSIAEAAKRAGISASHWRKMEAGKRTILPRMANAIRAALTPAGEAVVIVEAQPVQRRHDEEAFVSTPAAKVIPFEFEGEIINTIESDELMLTDRQLGRALGYAKEGRAIADLAAAHADELQSHSLVLDLRCTDGTTRAVRVWRERGVMLLTMFSQQPKAKAFRIWAVDTLYAARRGQPVVSQVSDIPAWAQALLQGMGRAVMDVQQQVRALTERVQDVERAGAVVNSEAVANAALFKIQALNTRKARLHELVRAIVKQARTLPDKDTAALPFRDYHTVWRAAHRSASPPVCKIADYVTQAQVNTAIAALEGLLLRLGGKVPAEQLEAKFESEV